MAWITTTTWVCDRCGCAHPAHPQPFEDGRVSISVGADFGTGKALVIDWQDLCVSCTGEVDVAIAALQDAATTARAAKEAVDAAE